MKPSERWLSADELREQIGTTSTRGRSVRRRSWRSIPASWGRAVRRGSRVDVDLYEYSPVMEVSAGEDRAAGDTGGTVRAKHAGDCDEMPIHRGSDSFGRRCFRYTTTLSLRVSSASTRLRRYQLDHWRMRYEERFLPVSTSVTPSGRFSAGAADTRPGTPREWGRHPHGARRLARTTDRAAVPVDGGDRAGGRMARGDGPHPRSRSIAGPLAGGNLHASVAYNGMGVVPAHNNGYLHRFSDRGRAGPGPRASLLHERSSAAARAAAVAWFQAVDAAAPRLMRGCRSAKSRYWSQSERREVVPPVRTW